MYRSSIHLHRVYNFVDFLSLIINVISALICVYIYVCIKQNGSFFRAMQVLHGNWHCDCSSWWGWDRKVTMHQLRRCRLIDMYHMPRNWNSTTLSWSQVYHITVTNYHLFFSQSLPWYRKNALDFFLSWPCLEILGVDRVWWISMS